MINVILQITIFLILEEIMDMMMEDLLYLQVFKQDSRKHIAILQDKRIS